MLLPPPPPLSAPPSAALLPIPITVSTGYWADELLLTVTPLPALPTVAAAPALTVTGTATAAAANDGGARESETVRVPVTDCNVLCQCECERECGCRQGNRAQSRLALLQAQSQLLWRTGWSLRDLDAHTQHLKRVSNGLQSQKGANNTITLEFPTAGAPSAAAARSSVTGAIANARVEVAAPTAASAVETITGALLERLPPLPPFTPLCAPDNKDAGGASTAESAGTEADAEPVETEAESVDCCICYEAMTYQEEVRVPKQRR